ncbi:MAG: caspase family protein, partial [Bacteroidales bacterium]|nr:caspase family protein [Bacteroidales bacterium]
MLKGNTVVFSAASGDETAMTYKEKGHGLFTYFLLKKLQETGGEVSYGELDKYIKTNVERESFLINEKDQTPTTNVSENAVNTWKNMKLK